MSAGLSDPELSRTNRDYRITLSCGCVVPARNQPMSAWQMFACNTGQGHGYQLPWLRYAGPGGISGDNDERSG